MFAVSVGLLKLGKSDGDPHHSRKKHTLTQSEIQLLNCPSDARYILYFQSGLSCSAVLVGDDFGELGAPPGARSPAR